MRSFLKQFIFISLLSLFVIPSARAQETTVAAETPAIIDELSIRDMDIREVIELIANKGGLNIVTGPNVQGRATIFLKSVDAREALRIILETNKLAYADEGGIIRVMTADEYQSRYGHAFGQEKVTRMIKVNFASVHDLGILLNEVKTETGKVIVNEEARTIALMDSAEKVRAMEEMVRQVDVQTITAAIPFLHSNAQDALETVRALLTQSVGAVECDTKENRLIVTDTLPKISKIKKLVADLDAAGRKVTLEARLVHIALNIEHLGGVDWSGILEEFRNIRLWGHYDFLDQSEDRVLSLGLILDDEFTMLLDALDTVGIVKEYPLADITIGQEDAIRLLLRMDQPSLDLSRVPAASINELDNNVTAGDASLEFYVRLAIDKDNLIQTRIIPHEAGSRAGDEASHTALMEFDRGQTIVMGGMIATEKIATTHKIPLMGDLPLLGFVFRFHDRSVRREEYVLFLTPRIENGAPVEREVKGRIADENN